jgi:hypothetical protein
MTFFVEWILFLRKHGRQDLQDYWNFVVHHFPEESDENQSAIGGTIK